MAIWNPWHGCKKYSSGCLHCYVYRRDASIGKDSRMITRTSSFDLPLQKNRNGGYKLSAEDNPVYTCMTSDFFLDEADEWRDAVWEMIRQRQDLEFIIITKRIDRAECCLPSDWGAGYKNVTLKCTCENQEETDRRLPILLQLPARHKQVICEPLLERIDMSSYLTDGQITHITCGGESGEEGRPCDYAWVLYLREQCVRAGISFYFKQTGTHFVKDGKTYYIERKLQMAQAKKADIGYDPTEAYEWDRIFERLSGSTFRSRFHLSGKEQRYIQEQGIAVIRRHAYDFIRSRLSAADIPNDGKQTPMHGHPVFIAQHACACCCRSCLKKWHRIPEGRELTCKEIDWIVALLMRWIEKQTENIR